MLIEEKKEKYYYFPDNHPGIPTVSGFHTLKLSLRSECVGEVVDDLIPPPVFIRLRLLMVLISDGVAS